MSDNKSKFLKALTASLIAIIAGMIIGAIIMALVGIFIEYIDLQDLWDGIRLLVLGIFNKGLDAAGNLVFGFNPVHIGNMLFKATPLIMTGLSVTVGLKAGLLNIGAPGQYLIGIMTSLAIALGIPFSVCPPWIILILALLGGMLSGALWGMIPGVFKAYLNVNEVITCILTNWIAADLVTLVFENSVFINTTDPGKSGLIYKTSVNGVKLPSIMMDKIFTGSQVNAGIVIAIVFAVLIYLMINKSIVGFEIRTCGSNRDAAKYCGINENRYIVMSMALAGALTGIGASLYTLSGNTEFFWSTYQTLPAVGFNGIPVALLGCLNPVGVIFSGMFMSALEINGQQIANLTSYNEYITSIIIGVIVYLAAFTNYIKSLFDRRKKGGKKK